MNEKNFLDLFQKIIQNNDDLKCHTFTNLSLDDDLKNRLGLDSIARMIILYELQELKPDLPLSEIRNWKSLRDIYNSVRSA